MALTHREVFERYLYAGALTRNPESLAAIFTEDGVYEAPLVPDDHPLSSRLVGRAAIRDGIRAYYEHPSSRLPGRVNAERSTYTLHATADPDVFIAEIDAVLQQTDGRAVTMSLVQIYRIRAGQIALLRDYFGPSPTTADADIHTDTDTDMTR